MNDTQNTPLDPKLIERIRKTLALSRDGGATEAEAATAAEFAQKLMRKYNLTMAEVEASGHSGGEGAKRTKQGMKGRAQYLFQQQLMLACAEVNFCALLTQKEWKRGKTYATGYLLIGRESNVIAAQHLFDYLMTTTERLAFEFVGEDNAQRLSKAAVSFKDGCATRLGERLRERHREAMVEQALEAKKRNVVNGGTPGTALAIVLTDFARDEEDFNNDLRYGWEPGTTKTRRQHHERMSKAFWAALEVLEMDDATDKALLMGRATSAIARLGGYTEEQILAQARLAVGQRLLRLAERVKEDKPETDAQRRKREEREQRESQREYARWEREYNKRDHYAYGQGAKAGDRVGLDKQVGSTKDSPKRLG